MFVYFKKTKDAHGKPMCIYWIKQLDPVTHAPFTVIGYSINVSFTVWLKLQKEMLAYWLLGTKYNPYNKNTQ